MCYTKYKSILFFGLYELIYGNCVYIKDIKCGGNIYWFFVVQ